MRYNDLIERMTLEEKASLMSGKNFWQTQDLQQYGIPSMFCADGSHGIRRFSQKDDPLGRKGSIPATCFPTLASMANSWDVDLLYEVGEALGEEAKLQEVNILLGPGVNIKRNPRCGRNFEYFSEDPYLTGKLAASYIRGVQSTGVAACVKHFAMNNQEEGRLALDTIVDERTMREIYLTAFEIAIKEGKAMAVMSAYNKVNGIYANENPHLLQDILRKEWGYQSVVISDWGADNDRVAALQCGSELEMPSTCGETDAQIIKVVHDGNLDENVLDAAVDRMLHLISLTKIDKKQVEESLTEESIVYERHHQLAKKAAQESIVLLKNEQAILPLDKKTTVAIIGDFAETPRYQGAGSSIVQPRKLLTTLECIQEADLNYIGYSKGYERFGEANDSLCKDAVKLAKKAEVVLFYLGLDERTEGEGYDREDLKVSKCQIDALNAVCNVQENVVVIISAGSVIEMPWADSVKGIVHGYLSGQAGAAAILEVITGKVNPSGRLAETYPMTYEDVPSATNFPGKEVTVEYREGIFVGYRYYQTAKIPVRYPFGFGLSYTKFEYSDLFVQNGIAEFTVKNVGAVAGAEVAQLYVSAKDSKVFRSEEELKGFVKVWLEPEQEKKIKIPFDDQTFRYFNAQENRWGIEGGTYELKIGSSSQEIHLSKSITIEGNGSRNPYSKEQLPSYYNGEVSNVSLEEFEILLGRKVPESRWDRSKPIGVNDTIRQLQYSKGWMARLFYYLLKGGYRYFDRKNNKQMKNVFQMVIFPMPFRSLARMTGGAWSMPMVEALLDAINGHFMRGMIRLYKESVIWKKHKQEISDLEEV